MKKIFLLLTIICTGHLYGMDPTSPVPDEASSEVWVEELRRTGPIKTQEEERAQKEAISIYTSPEMLPELKKEIIGKALVVSKNFWEVSNIIQKFSILHGVEFDNLFNIKNFSKLMRILKNRSYGSCFEVARGFNIRVAEKYKNLFTRLFELTCTNNITELKDVIEQGADVNSLMLPIIIEYLRNMEYKALQPSLEIIKLFLENGANPNAKIIQRLEGSLITALDYLNEHFQNAPEYEQIKELLEKAMQKQKK